MRTLLTIYLTALHLFAVSMGYLYFGDSYALARVQHDEAKAECCNGDQLTAYLDKQLSHKKGK